MFAITWRLRFFVFPCLTYPWDLLRWALVALCFVLQGGTAARNQRKEFSGASEDQCTHCDAEPCSMTTEAPQASLPAEAEKSRSGRRRRCGSPRVYSFQGHGEVRAPTSAPFSFLERMPKGRRFNPPIDKDGKWFPHIGLMQKTPESITTATLKEPHFPHSSGQVERKLPLIYKVREKQAAKNLFPFSEHDNRHSFENTGDYFDAGFGRKKIPPDKRQQVSRNFNLWASDYVPSCLDGFSNNRISYVHKEAMMVPNFRRFPRRYNELWSYFTFIP